MHIRLTCTFPQAVFQILEIILVSQATAINERFTPTADIVKVVSRKGGSTNAWNFRKKARQGQVLTR